MSGYFCEGPHCQPVYENGKQVAVDCRDCPLCEEMMRDWELDFEKEEFS